MRKTQVHVIKVTSKINDYVVFGCQRFQGKIETERKHDVSEMMLFLKNL